MGIECANGLPKLHFPLIFSSALTIGFQEFVLYNQHKIYFRA
jgi:hypothetical protein